MSDSIYIRRNLKGMAVSGLWDYPKFKNPIKNFLFKTYGMIVWVYFLCFNISEFVEMYYVKGDFPLLMQNAGVSLLYGVLILKTYTIKFRTNRIESLLETLRQEERRALNRNEEEQKVYFETVDQNWFITKLFWFVCFSTILMFYIARPAEYFALGPQEIHHYKVPLVFSSWFPFDKYAPGYFEVAFASQVLSGCVGAYYVGVSDTLIVALMIFSIGQFRMLQCSIKSLHIGADDEQREFQNVGDLIDVWDKVVDTVKHHCRIIDYLNELDDLINPIILMNFIVCSMMICAVGLEGIIAGPSIRFALSMYYLAALLIQLFLFYWHANEVTFESINVGRAVTDSEWYKFTHKDKQALLMVLTRAQKPSVLSVGGFYPMSLSTFLMILRGTYSYLALFRTVYSKGQTLQAEESA